ncbi:MAG: hypothetical protein HY903_05125 [Deltaproteobacteria bacterium]|nr:hypothetical protein [Deltaproteobacteria bacterium]
MPSTKSANPFLKMAHVDLAYAVQRLTRLGMTTVAQVQALGAERQAEIAQLQARVTALKAAVDVGVATFAKRAVGRPKGSKNKIKIAKAAAKVQRQAKPSSKVAAAQRIQGRYMGLRRHLSPQLQARATKIAQARGVAAALKFVESKRVKRVAPAKPKMKMTPKMRAARKIQGRYLGLRRRLSRELQTEATRIAQTEGVAAALRFAEAKAASQAA